MRIAGACVTACLTMASHDAGAFPYTAQRGDTLAEIAEKFYGRVEMEKVLVAANGFDDEVPLLPGMRVEVPAVSYYRVAKGETEWPADAARRRRGARPWRSNDTMPWIPPLTGREIVVPYPLRYVVRGGDNVLSIAYRFLGDRDDAYVVDRFNHLKGEPLEPGDVVIVPITDLILTDEGRDAAKESQRLVLGEGGGEDRDAQDRAEREMPLLDGEVRAGKPRRSSAATSSSAAAGSQTPSSVT
jgi:phage tail protein X